MLLQKMLSFRFIFISHAFLQLKLVFIAVIDLLMWACNLFIFAMFVIFYHP
jgi:hypothetical protein